MPDLAPLGLQFKTQGGDQMVRTLDQVASGSKAAEAGVQAVGEANVRASQTFGQAASEAGAASGAFGRFAEAAKMAARNMADFSRTITSPAEWRNAAREIRAQQAALNDNASGVDAVGKAHGRLRGQMGMTSLMTARLGREFIDLGAMMATGIANPTATLNILISMFAHASEMGMSFGQVIGSVFSSLKPFVAFLGTVGVVAGAAFGTAALAARHLNEEHKNLLDGLGLDEKQLEHLKEAHVATTVTIGDVWKGVWAYITDQVDQHTKKQQKILSGWLDDAAHFIARFGAAAVGAFAAGFEIIKTIWKELPNVIGEAITGAVNATLKGVQMMVNGAADGINKLIHGANALDKAVLGAHAAVVGDIGHVEFGQFANPNAGAGGRLAADVSGPAAMEAARKAVATYNSILTGMGNAITKAAQDRIKEEAGDPAKARKPARTHEQQDRTDQRTAQVDQMVAQAKAQELQAQLALVKDLKRRDEIEHQINAAELAVQQAQVDRAIAEIQHDRGLDDATKKTLAARLDGVKATQAHVAVLKNQLADQQRDAGIAKQNADVDMAVRDSHLDLLKAQQGLAQSVLGRWRLEEKILSETQDKEKADLQDQLKIATINNDEGQIRLIKAHMTFLEERQALERQQLVQEHKLVDIYDDINNQAKSVAQAFKDHDWAHAASGLIDAIRTAIEAFKNASTAAEKIQSVAGAISGVGNMIGGKVGGFLSGVGSGASAGAQIGGLFGPVGGVIGGIAGGLFGGISSLFGGNAKKKQELRDAQNQAAEAEAQRAQEVADQRRQIELQLVEASGNQLAILNAQRADELSKTSAENQALLKQVYEAQDRMTRSNQLYDIEIDYLTLSGDKMALLTRQRQKENESIDASLLALKGLERAAQDAQDAVDTAKQILQAAYDAEISRLQQQLADQQQALSQATDALSAAYDRQSSSLTDLISKFTDFGTSLRAFRTSLDTSSAGMSPQNAYNAASSSFYDIARKAQLGDEQAMADFQQAAQDFLSNSANFNGAASQQYQRDLAAVKDATEKAAATAARTVSNAQAQLDQLKKLVSGYLNLNDNTLSIDAAIKNLVTAQQAAKQTQDQIDAVNALVGPLLGIQQATVSVGMAVANYQAAVAQQSAAIQALANAVQAAKADPNNQPIAPPTNTGIGAYTSTNGDYAAYVQQQPDLLALWTAQKGMAKGRTEAEFGVYHWANFGKNENRSVRPYAQGGEFMVGGSGGTDSQRVQFMASPDEHVTVRTPQQMATDSANAARMARALEKAVERLEQLVSEAKADKTQRGAATRHLAEKLDGVVNAVDGVKRSVRGQPQPKGRAA